LPGLKAINMLETFNLTILKVETLDEVNNAAVDVFEDGKLKAQVEMTAPSVSTISIQKSWIQLRMVNTDLSVSFDAGLLQPQGFHLIPLFEGGNDKLESLSKFPPMPRILLDIHPQLLTPLPDLTESSEFFENFSEAGQESEMSKLRSKNNELIITVGDLESALLAVREKNQQETEEITKKYKEKVRELSEEIEKLSIIQVKNLKISSDIVKENESLKEKVNRLGKENEEVNEELQRYLKLHNERQAREDSILSILEIKDKEIMRMRKRHSSENFKTQKLDPIRLMQKSNRCKRLDLDDCGQVISGKDKFETLKGIDQKIEEFTKSKGLEGIFQLNHELIYNIGNKKVVGLLKKDLVYIRVGTCLRPLEVYINNNCAQEVQAFKLKRKKSESKPPHKKSNTLCDLEKIENSLICKSFDSRLKAKLFKIKTPRYSVQPIKTPSPVSQILTARNLNIY